MESQTKSTGATLTTAPDGTPHTLTVRKCRPSKSAKIRLSADAGCGSADLAPRFRR
jgi:hypothetical protein